MTISYMLAISIGFSSHSDGSIDQPKNGEFLRIFFTIFGAAFNYYNAIFVMLNMLKIMDSSS